MTQFVVSRDSLDDDHAESGEVSYNVMNVPSGSLCRALSESAGDAELAQVLERYLGDLEAGRCPDIHELVREHPAIADRLKACLESLRVLQQAAGGLGPLTDTSNLAGPARSLGDFHIIRQLGRGGMGVVYEAEQVSLGRRVALKVLPLAALLDGRQLERFKNEARAAAMLKHPNIVSVYSVGCEHGVHYYAMELVEGQTLADVIAGVRHAVGWANADHARTPS